MSNSTGIDALVAKFADNIRDLKAPTTKEATLRVQFLDPFFKLLGWDVSNDAGLPSEEQEVVIEPSIDVAERDKLRARRPDYLFRIAGQNQLTCEAKKPAVDIDRDKDAIFQAKRDAYSMGLPFAILTDFEQFRVYDTGYQPDYDLPRHGIVPEFSLGFSDYRAQWDVIHATFSRDAVANGSLDKLRARVRGIRAGQRIRGIDRELFELRGDKPAGDAFLAQLESQREHVASDLYARNRAKFPDVNTPRGAARLAEFTQRVIDRVVFMRICEDRNVVSYGLLRDLVEESGSQSRELRDLLIRQFRQYDRDFNGYVFKPHDIETCQFTPSVLRELLAQFYPPESRTNFATLPDDVLATVYERFLGSTITVNRGRVEIEPKPEVRHAGGVYYTPRFIVDSILRRVVAPKLKGKKPLDLLGNKLTILDPACGSGSFLIAAYDMLIRHCEQMIAADPSLAKVSMPGFKKKQPIAFQQTVILATSAAGQATKTEKVWRLTPDFKGELLTDCIFGIDIDQQAVEVTIMSLYSKVLHNLPSDWRGISEHRLLPPLDNNIRCGNSLIDQDRLDTYAEELHGGLFTGDDNVRFRINAFDWHSQTRGFGRVLGNRNETSKGFDCVIGNPPYIRVQELNKWAPDECRFYKWQYRSAAKGNYDIYVAFTERVLTGGKDARGLLKLDGVMGFIMPHKWWKATYGAGLRNIVAHGQYLRGLVDFGDQQVFKGAMTYTAIHVLTNHSESKGLDYAKVLVLVDGREQCADLDAGRAPTGTLRFKADKPAGAEPWVFANATDTRWLDAVRSNHWTLGDITSKIAQGLVSGCDPVFYIERRGKEYFSEQTGQLHPIEKALLHPLLKGSLHIRRWAMDPTPLCVLFPYTLLEGTWKLIEPKEMQEKYPLASAYLRKCRGPLIDREKKELRNEQGELVIGSDGQPEYDRPFAGPNFYRFSRPQNFEIMPTRKLLVPAMAERAEYAIDEKGEYYFVGSGGGGGGAHAIVPKIDVSLEYLCGLLNSKLLDTFLQRVTTPFHGGWFAYSKSYIQQIPIKLPVTASEKKLAERIEAAVKQIIEDKERLNSGAVSGDRDRRDLESRIESAERYIDDYVMTLYGVDRLLQ